MILYGGHDQHSTFPVQQRVMESFHANGQSLEWHYFHFGYHGFASTESDGYQPYLADLVWPLVTEFLGREPRSELGATWPQPRIQKEYSPQRTRERLCGASFENCTSRTF
jgi:hypothetical protein